jgi:hypothetical protein
MTTPGENVREEPQEERGAPGSRDTGSDQPSGGPTDRPSGTYEGDESVPEHGAEGGKPEFQTGTTNEPPGDAKPAVPPYEGRKESADVGDDSAEAVGARTGGATRPTADADYKSPAPGESPGGATASPAQERPASQTTEADRDDDQVDAPAHTPGTGRAEDKR